MNSSSPASRRGFLAGAVAAPAILSAQPSSKKIRVAYIGVGNRGSYTMGHTMNVEGVDLVAICDLNPEALKKGGAAAEAKGNKPRLFTDYRKMIEEMKDIDAIVIATPTKAHLPMTLAALEAGKHVFCEKPMGFDEKECEVIEKATMSAKGIYQAGFQLRHHPARNAAVKFILNGGIGKVLYLQGYRHSNDLPKFIPWLFDRDISGDNIVEQACHILDLFVWAIGKPPVRAMGSGGINLYKNDPPGRTVMDNYSVIYEFPDDIRVTFSHIYFDPPGFSGIKERVYGSTGAIDLATATWKRLGEKESIQLEVDNPTGNADFLSMQSFIENARSGKKPLNDAANAKLSTLVGILGRKAIHEKRIVTWDEITRS
jgi:myo-inositol 2-dehydrogenase / D-chiro-inositol 1-dehydrogenase